VAFLLFRSVPDGISVRSGMRCQLTVLVNTHDRIRARCPHAFQSFCTRGVPRSPRLQLPLYKCFIRSANASVAVRHSD